MSLISVRQLGKQYQLGQKAHNTLRDQIAGWMGRGEAKQAESFWALKDVSFDVGEAEVVGIVGRNGAGKSTLLKILSQITDPTEGEVRIRGRVASLLEVGTGFHPELSGRENVFLNGAILGMSRAEIRRKFDEIVAFAEVEKFIDTAVKHYSSGMYVRLAFAVAAHLEPEILIVDEVLAVGDGAFQRKCLGKMGEVSKSGRTILFVSHNLTAVRSLCQSAVLLESGRLALHGPVDEVLHRYIQGGGLGAALEWKATDDRRPADQVCLTSARVVVADERGVLDTDAPVDIELEYWNGRADVPQNLSVVLYTEDDVPVFNDVSPRKAMPVGMVRGTCHIPRQFLNAMSYRVRVLIVEQGRVLTDDPAVLSFEVAEGRRESLWHGKWIGVVRPRFTWDFEPSTASLS